MLPSSPGHRPFLHRCAAVILFAGICLSAFVYWSAPPATDSAAAYDDAPLAPEDSRRYAHDSEVNFGKAGAFGDKGRRMLGHLGEPKPLAITIIVLSAVLAAGCLVAGQVSPPDDEGAPH